jgi:hypothetical protein
LIHILELRVNYNLEIILTSKLVKSKVKSEV